MAHVRQFSFMQITSVAPLKLLSIFYESLFKSYVTLFWSLFGLTQLGTVREGKMQSFTKIVGEYLLMVYHAMAVIVLINMLIAMMSNSFQEIEVIVACDVIPPLRMRRRMRTVSSCVCDVILTLCLLRTL